MKTWIDNLKPLRTDFKSIGDAAIVEAERAMDLQAGLPADLKIVARGHRRRMIDFRRSSAAAKLLERLPEPDEAFHCVVRGSFALWDVVTAIIALAKPATIDDLHICTLGFSRENTSALFGLLDDGTIGRATLLCSHYFSATSKDIYGPMAAGMEQRGQTFVSMRTHAKLLAIKLTDARTVTVEASANLRSCKNIEQLTIFGDPKLYEFHTTWIQNICEEHHHERQSTTSSGDPSGTGKPTGESAKVWRADAGDGRTEGTRAPVASRAQGLA